MKKEHENKVIHRKIDEKTAFSGEETEEKNDEEPVAAGSHAITAESTPTVY